MNNCIGIVLNQREYRDNDMIVSILTKEYGVISMVARGLKKNTSKNASACTLFCKSDFSFINQNKNDLMNLKTATNIKMYYKIYENLNKQMIASLLCEACLKSNVEDYESIFDLLDLCLNNLHSNNNDFGILGFFFAQLNKLIGITPNVDACIFCKDTHKIVGLSIYEGGFVCQNCCKETHKKLSVEELRIFRLFHKASIYDYDILNNLKIFEFKDIEQILYFYIDNSGVALKGISLLKKVVSF